MPNRAPAHQPPSLPVHRPSAADRGYDHRWQKARITFLREHPLCVECELKGELTAAVVVDHVVPHRGDEMLFWDVENNWQALCLGCHNRKTGGGK